MSRRAIYDAGPTWVCVDGEVVSRQLKLRAMATMERGLRVHVAAPNIDAHVDDDDCLLAFSGEIDHASVRQLAVMTKDLLCASSAGRTTLDLSRVTFMDAAGLGLLVEIHQAARRQGASVRLLGLPGRVERLIVLGGLSEEFGLTAGTARS